MDRSVASKVAALPRMTVRQLQRRYAEAFGEETNGNNKAWLVKRIAWRLQARAEGGLSERALRRAATLADDADLRLSPPRMPAPGASSGPTREASFAAAARLPPPGTVLVREYKGESIRVLVRSDGFEYAGQTYRSLSAVAKAITGSHCSGYLFFRLRRDGGAA